MEVRFFLRDFLFEGIFMRFFERYAKCPPNGHLSPRGPVGEPERDSFAGPLREKIV